MQETALAQGQFIGHGRKRYKQGSPLAKTLSAGSVHCCGTTEFCCLMHLFKGLNIQLEYRAMHASKSDFATRSPAERLRPAGQPPAFLPPLRSAGEFAACAAIYAAGQCCNLLFQLLLLRHFGAEGYGWIGLSHLIFLLVTFVGDLGYSTLFLREKPDSAVWERQWRLALGHRLMATVALYAVTLTGWCVLYGRRGEGFDYLAATVPAGLFGIASLASVLLAQGRRVPSLIVQQMPWPAALLAWWMLGGGDGSAARAGLIVSAAFLFQPVVALCLGGRARLLLPAFGAGSAMFAAALRLSAMGVTGALHDRLTPFLVARLAPDFLPAMLLLGHAVNGASGVLMQVNRLLLPHLGTPEGLAWSLRTLALTSIGVAVAFQLMWLAMMVHADGGIAFHPNLLLPALMAGCISFVGSVLATELIGRHLEGQLTRIILTGIAISTALQLLGAIQSSSDGVLWARVITVAGITAASLRSCGIMPEAAGWALCGSLVSAALGVLNPLAWLGSTLLLVGVFIAIACGRTLFRRRSAIAAEPLS